MCYTGKCKLENWNGECTICMPPEYNKIKPILVYNNILNEFCQSSDWINNKIKQIRLNKYKVKKY